MNKTKTEETILKFHELGFTVLQITRETGISGPMIYKTYKKFGIKANTTASGNEARDAEIVERITIHNQQVSEICADMGVRPQTVYSVLKREGIPSPQYNIAYIQQKEAAMQRALQLYQSSSMTMKQISMETGIPQPIISTEVKRRGIKPRQFTMLQQLNNN